MKEDLRFPIGRFDKNISGAPELRKQCIQTILNSRENLGKAVAGLSEQQLDTPYRPEGWTVRQTIHHVADSHLNAFIRFKLALTEIAPVIRPYHEERWAELSDSLMPIDVSLKIIEGVHLRWANLIKSMPEEDFQRKLIHPESGEWNLDELLALYSWHSRHHTAHITHLRIRENW